MRNGNFFFCLIKNFIINFNQLFGLVYSEPEGTGCFSVTGPLTCNFP